MADPREAVRIHGEAARGPISDAGMRYVLGFSVGMAVIAISGTWIIPALLG